MSRCGYYSCSKGKPICRHPELGTLYSTSLRGTPNQCDRCRKRCGGIYPSQLPKADQHKSR